MELAQLFNDQNVITFFLLFARVGGLIAFFPFFSHMSIPVSVKTSLSLYLVFLFFPVVHFDGAGVVSAGSIMMMMFAEFTLGFIAGLALNLIFGALGLAGMQVSMVMGFSMATVMDPTTQTNSPIISQIFTLLAILILLAFDGHHLMLLFLSESITHIELGSFYPQAYMWRYLSDGFTHMFVMGFIIAFPIIAISILADVIFGMLMKTMPQFNLLVVGFPIKIFLSVMVLMAILGSMMGIFRREFIDVFAFLKQLLSI
jgi:flagellar biosynthetic protein FliR